MATGTARYSASCCVVSRRSGTSMTRILRRHPFNGVFAGLGNDISGLVPLPESSAGYVARRELGRRGLQKRPECRRKGF